MRKELTAARSHEAYINSDEGAKPGGRSEVHGIWNTLPAEQVPVGPPAVEDLPGDSQRRLLLLQIRLGFGC